MFGEYSSNSVLRMLESGMELKPYLEYWKACMSWSLIDMDICFVKS